MPNPTYEELRAHPAYAHISDEELKGLYAKKFGAEQPEWKQEPTAMGRLKRLATDPTLLKGVGTAAGLALAPEGMIPAMIMGGAGSTGGGLASSIARDEHRTPGQSAMDFAEGAVTPILGQGMQKGAEVLRGVGGLLPKNFGFYGALAGPKGLASTLALRGATAESALPRFLDFAGENYNKVINAVQGSARRVMGSEAEAAVDPAVAQTRAMVNKLTGKSAEQTYRMPTGQVEPYQPRGFRQSFRDLQSEPGPMQPEVVEPVASHQVKPDMSEVDALTEGINSKVPMSRARLAASHPQNPVVGGAEVQNARINPQTNEWVIPGHPNQPVSMSSLRQATTGGNGGDASLLPYSSSFPAPSWGGMAPRGTLPTEMIPGGMEERLGEIAAENAAAGPKLAASHVNGRPAPEFVHPSDTTGSQFGFDHLPEISEAELSRLQALFKRVGAR